MINKIITVAGHFNASNTFSSQIMVNFPTSYVILRGYTVNNVDFAAGDPMLVLRSSLINNETLLTICPSTQYVSEEREVKFQLPGQPINNLHSFQLMTINGTLPTNEATINTYISITLEFISS